MSIHLLKIQFVNCFIDNEKRINRGYGKKYELNVFHDGLSYRLITQYGVLCLSKSFSNNDSKTFDSEYDVLREVRKIISRKRLKKHGYDKPYSVWDSSGTWIETQKVYLHGFQKCEGMDFRSEFP